MTLLARNATIFKFTGSTRAQFEGMLANRKFTPLTGVDATRSGFVQPVSYDDSLLLFAQEIDVGAFSMRTDTKILPACVIKAEVEHRAGEIEERQGFKIGRKQRRELTEQVTDILIGKAFTRTTIIRCWADFKAGLLVIDSPSATKVEDVLLALHGGATTAGFELLVSAWHTKNSPAASMTAWLRDEIDLDGFTFDDSALFEKDEGGKVRITKQDVRADALCRLLDSESTVSELAMTWKDKVSFVLTKNLVLKRMTHLGFIYPDGNQGDMLEQELRDAEVVLNAGTVREMMASINEIMGGAR